MSYSYPSCIKFSVEWANLKPS